jgi:hypothetical protein
VDWSKEEDLMKKAQTNVSGGANQPTLEKNQVKKSPNSSGLQGHREERLRPVFPVTQTNPQQRKIR